MRPRRHRLLTFSCLILPRQRKQRALIHKANHNHAQTHCIDQSRNEAFSRGGNWIISDCRDKGHLRTFHVSSQLATQFPKVSRLLFLHYDTQFSSHSTQLIQSLGIVFYFSIPAFLSILFFLNWLSIFITTWKVNWIEGTLAGRGNGGYARVEELRGAGGPTTPRDVFSFVVGRSSVFLVTMATLDRLHRLSWSTWRTACLLRGTGGWKTSTSGPAPMCLVSHLQLALPLQIRHRPQKKKKKKISREKSPFAVHFIHFVNYYPARLGGVWTEREREIKKLATHVWISK